MARQLSTLDVLVVEDNSFVQRVISQILDKIGVASVSVSSSGEEALAFLGHDDTACDLIICDIEMPGIDGFALTRQIRFGNFPKFQDVPILMLTGEDTEENVTRGQMYNISAYLVKPPTEEMLREHIAKALG